MCLCSLFTYALNITQQLFKHSAKLDVCIVQMLYAAGRHRSFIVSEVTKSLSRLRCALLAMWSTVRREVLAIMVTSQTECLYTREMSGDAPKYCDAVRERERERDLFR